MKNFIDERGFMKMKSDPETQILADFLEGDIQGSIYSADEYINACLSVEHAQIPRWEGTGNAHTVTMENGGVEIFNEYTGKSMQINGIGHFRACLDAWKRLLIAK